MKTQRKRLTREIVEMKAHGATYADIGRKLGASRQYAQQFFAPLKASRRIVADRARGECERCGKFDHFGHFHHKVYDFDTLNSPDNLEYLCASCHKSVDSRIKTCANCGQTIRKGKFCSPECRKAMSSVVHSCSHCGKSFIMDSAQKKRIRLSSSGLIFCTKQCQGSYMGLHFGFAAHPEHCRGKGATKYDSKIVAEVALRLRSGQTYEVISRDTGIPMGTINSLNRRNI